MEIIDLTVHELQEKLKQYVILCNAVVDAVGSIEIKNDLEEDIKEIK